jgi:hypothetical protein
MVGQFGSAQTFRRDRAAKFVSGTGRFMFQQLEKLESRCVLADLQTVLSETAGLFLTQPGRG